MTIQATPPAVDDRTLARLVIDLRDEVSTLARQEVALAKAELAEKTRTLARAAACMAAAAVLAAFSVVALTAALIVGLAQVMPGWLAATCVMVAYLLSAFMLIVAGTRRLRRIGTGLPTLTMHRIKEDLRWLRRRAL